MPKKINFEEKARVVFFWRPTGKPDRMLFHNPFLFLLCFFTNIFIQRILYAAPLPNDIIAFSVEDMKNEFFRSFVSSRHFLFFPFQYGNQGVEMIRTWYMNMKKTETLFKKMCIKKSRFFRNLSFFFQTESNYENLFFFCRQVKKWIPNWNSGVSPLFGWHSAPISIFCQKIKTKTWTYAIIPFKSSNISLKTWTPNTDSKNKYFNFRNIKGKIVTNNTPLFQWKWKEREEAKKGRRGFNSQGMQLGVNIHFQQLVCI